MNRRQFNAGLVNAGLAGTAIAAGAARAAGDPAHVTLYGAAGDAVTRYELDPATGALAERESLRLPSAVQYAWPHPSGRYLYVATSDAPDGGPPGSGSVHRLCALKADADGVLAPHGAPAVLAQRPINNSVDAGGRFALTCYSSPANLTVHRIAGDGTLGEEVRQAATLDYGIFPHQIRTLPANRSVVLVTRGNNATPTRPEDPGALKLFRFRDGQLTPLADLRVGGHGGLGYGPRHLDFHPRKPWAYVALERQSELHMHRLEGDGLAPAPAFVRKTASVAPMPGAPQLAGAIHVHPRGHVVYVSNRARGEVEFAGKRVFRGGENSVAVFAIDPATGAPMLVQHVDTHGFNPRSFTLDPGGRWLVAADSVDMLVRDGDAVRPVPAGLGIFRVAEDGTLRFVGRHAVALPGKAQLMWVGTLRMG